MVRDDMFNSIRSTWRSPRIAFPTDEMSTTLKSRFKGYIRLSIYSTLIITSRCKGVAGIHDLCVVEGILDEISNDIVLTESVYMKKHG